MKEFSKETIEIENVEYTLFLDRKGIIAWEKFCKEENARVAELQDKYKSIIANDSKEIGDETNPFEGLENLDDFQKDGELISSTYRKLYWIMLYSEHKLNIQKVNELYDKACEEYGETNLIALAQQMIEDANTDRVSQKELKNLAALRPKK